MRIALVAQLFPPEHEGGTELVVRAQARALTRLGHDVLVIVGSEQVHDNRDVIWDHHGRLEVARLPRLDAERPATEHARPRLEPIVLALVEGFDVAHVHHWSTLSSGLVRALSSQVPVVVTLHDAFAACPRTFRSPPDPGVTCPRGGSTVPCVRCLAPDVDLDEAQLVAALRERAQAFAGELEAAAAILVPSRFQAQRMQTALGLDADAIEVLPHGLCRDLPAPSRARTAWNGNGPLRVLHFGNLVEAKGILDLVRSLALLPPGSAELDLAGACLEPGLEERVRVEAGGLPVRLSGAYGTRRLARLAVAADLAAFPSRLEESYGLVVDEAAALGLPVWVSDRGALPERMTDLGCGRVLPSGDVEAWTAAFERLLAHPGELAEARARALPPAPCTAAVDRLEELYRGLSRART